MIPGSQYAFTGLIVCCFLIFSGCVGFLAYNVMAISIEVRKNTKINDYVKYPTKTYITAARIASILITALTFYALSPVMMGCIKWGSLL